MNLSLRRGNEGVELVIEGVGDQPFLQQRLNGQVWEGSLQTQGAPGVRNGQVRLSDPVIGIQSATLVGSGSSYALKVKPSPGRPLKDPVVSADGRDLILKFPGLVVAPTLQTGRLNLNTPGRVPQTQYAPPLRPRAVAPPLGDMAVGTMVMQNRSYVNVSGPPVTLTLNNAPAKDALMALARLGGYGFVFVGEQDGGSKDVALPSRPVSIAFQNESYARALNGVLLASGLQGKLDGRTLMVGSKVSANTFGPQMSKVYRLNQSSAVSAAKYLGSLGASIQEPVPLKTTSILEEASGDASNSISNTSEQIEIRSYSSGQGPLVGLIGTTDSRLQTITLIGDSLLVKLAEGYLRQIDLRQRQVALSVRILDVSLDNDSAISNSFAFRYGNNFIVSDRGELVGAFGNLLPPNNSNFDAIAGGAESGKFQREIVSGRDAQIADRLIPPSPTPSRINPGNVFPKDNLLDLIRSIIISNSTKTLASPTLILSENPVEISGGADVATSVGNSALQTATIGRSKANESFVTVGTQETVNYSVSAGQNGAPNSCQPILGTAGLTFGARVSKIDDNGFVSFSLSPTIAAVTGTQNVEGCGPRSILSVRRLDTGSLRVRDGQTLILTGVISDRDAQQVRKWPILGDLPLIGQFFRESTRDRAKRELVVLVTPKIISDDQGGNYGYGYQPSLPAARQLMSNDAF
ncbi:type II secretion system protein GspD [Synechococcus sp. CC9311]|uniref:type II secretion system protein GspD n=1 Tax=Synechococcus sp. (strain CC9311) TaxID=64471 RepID=UPI001ED91093|nr:general secretion pathway protein GspD [Synechococcus sp. CC9311]